MPKTLGLRPEGVELTRRHLRQSQKRAQRVHTRSRQAGLQSEHSAIAMQRAFACISKRFHPLSPQCDQQDQESPAPHTPQFTAAHTGGFRCSKRAPTPRERLRRISQANMYTYTVSHVGSHAGRGQARRLHARTAAQHLSGTQAARGTHSHHSSTGCLRNGAPTHHCSACRQQHPQIASPSSSLNSASPSASMSTP